MQPNQWDSGGSQSLDKVSWEGSSVPDLPGSPAVTVKPPTEVQASELRPWHLGSFLVNKGQLAFRCSPSVCRVLHLFHLGALWEHTSGQELSRRRARLPGKNTRPRAPRCQGSRQHREKEGMEASRQPAPSPQGAQATQAEVTRCLIWTPGVGWPGPAPSPLRTPCQR